MKKEKVIQKNPKGPAAVSELDLPPLGDILDKIDCLRCLIETNVMAEDQALGSEPILNPAFTTAEVKVIKQKILELIKTF